MYSFVSYPDQILLVVKMEASGANNPKKIAYDARMCTYLEEFSRAFIIHVDNVGSKQFQDVRASIRPESIILMGKNTMMKRTLRAYIERTGDTKWACLLDQLVGNVGICFTKSELSDVRAEIYKYKVPAPARVGSVAQCDVVIPAGPTGMDPSQTSFFQVLNIATKINKGSVEILNDVKVVVEGERVGSSAAALLVKMNIKPFTYGIKLLSIVEGGASFPVAVLDISDEDIMKGFSAGLANVTALSLGSGVPTAAAVPHVILNAYKNLLSIAVATDYCFKQAEKVKEMADNPEAFAAMAAAAAATTASGGGADAGAAAAAAPVVEEEEEEEEEEMEFDLFD